mmetsp:Transcript_26863/g.65284  ORF Transcript_26863/g.65284 Transcript_26863/m.65284 type:complete len:220 (-) Transcript_26863:368-1027(-)
MDGQDSIDDMSPTVSRSTDSCRPVPCWSGNSNSNRICLFWLVLFCRLSLRESFDFPDCTDSIAKDLVSSDLCPDWSIAVVLLYSSLDLSLCLDLLSAILAISSPYCEAKVGMVLAFGIFFFFFFLMIALPCCGISVTFFFVLLLEDLDFGESSLLSAAVVEWPDIGLVQELVVESDFVLLGLGIDAVLFVSVEVRRFLGLVATFLETELTCWPVNAFVH